MDAYRVPLVAALLVAIATAALLGAVRLGRWWRAFLDRRAGRWSWPEAGLAATDLQLPQLAHRTLGAALLVAATALLLFTDVAAGARAPGEPLIPAVAAAALAAAWWAGRP